MQPVPITTNVVSTNPADGEVYSIQPYIMQFVSDMRQVGGTVIRYLVVVLYLVACFDVFLGVFKGVLSPGAVTVISLL